jgi:hypothetical protein
MSGVRTMQDTPKWFGKLVAEIERGLGYYYGMEEAKCFRARIEEVLPAGAGLTPVLFKYLRWALVDENQGIVHITKPGSKPWLAVTLVAGHVERWLRGDCPSREEWEKLRSDVYYQWCNSSNYALGVASWAAYAASLEDGYSNSAEWVADLYTKGLKTRQHARCGLYLRQSKKLVELNLSAKNSQIELTGAA